MAPLAPPPGSATANHGMDVMDVSIKNILLYYSLHGFIYEFQINVDFCTSHLSNVLRKSEIYLIFWHKVFQVHFIGLHLCWSCCPSILNFLSRRR